MKRVEDHPILAIDPGLRELGYAVLHSKCLLDWGVLPLRRIPEARRPLEIARAIEGWSRAYAPGSLVLEQTAHHRDGRLGPLHRLGLRLTRLGGRLGLQVTTHSVKAVRKAIVGDGWAGKREAAEVVTARFPQLRVYLTQDRKWKAAYWGNMYDAVALALYHQLLINQPPSRSR